MKEELERKVWKLHEVAREHAGEAVKYAVTGAVVWYFFGFAWSVLPLSIAAYQAFKSDKAAYRAREAGKGL